MHFINIYMNSLLSLQVKVLKKPRFEVSRLMELHGDAGKGSNTGEDLGSSVDRPDNYEPHVQASV